jgi:hypothetical protein
MLCNGNGLTSYVNSRSRRLRSLSKHPKRLNGCLGLPPSISSLIRFLDQPDVR